MSELQKAATPTEKAATTEDGLIKRITAVFEDAMQSELTIFKAQLAAEREKIIKENEDMLEKALRQSLGVDKDLPVTRSQIAEVVRKAMLEEAETQKRTPAPTVEKAGSDAPKADPFDELVKAKGLV